MRPLVPLALGLALALGGVAAGPPAGSIHVGPFSLHPGALPPGWEPLEFPRIPRHTVYRVVDDGGTPVLLAESEASASGLVRRVQIDTASFPLLRWRWRVERVVPGGDVRRKEGDDYAARVYLIFDKPPSSLPWRQRLLYRMATTFYGPLPTRALSYVWATREKVGTLHPSPYTDFAYLVIAESGDARAGAWVDEEHDVRADYARAFGEEPPPLVGVAVMTDSDDTGTRARAWYGDVWLSPPAGATASPGPGPSADRTR